MTKPLMCVRCRHPYAWHSPDRALGPDEPDTTGTLPCLGSRPGLLIRRSPCTCQGAVLYHDLFPNNFLPWGC